MGDIADDLIEGKGCSLCGVVFEKAHEYSVLCHSCWQNYDDRRPPKGDITEEGWQRAIFKEL